MAGLERSYIGDIENAQTHVTVAALMRVTCGLNTTVSHLLANVERQAIQELARPATGTPRVDYGVVNLPLALPEEFPDGEDLLW